MKTENKLDFTQHNPNTANSISDLAEALRALQRVCGFSHNHNDIFLACLAAAHGRNEFRASFAELGARMSSEVEPHKKNMSESEQKNRRRALELKFKRAYKRLEEDQRATGLWFVTVQSGGIIDGKRVSSSIRIEVDVINRTVELARESEDFTEYRLRCFQRAAEKVRDGMVRRYVPADSDSTAGVQSKGQRPESQLRRYESNIKTYSRKLYNYAATQEGFTEDVANELKERIQAKLDRWFAVDFPTLLEAEKQDAERAANRPERMAELTRRIKATGGKGHTSDHHTKGLRDADVCTFGAKTQDAISTPPVILNGSEREPLTSDSGGDGAALTDALKALDLVRSVGAWQSNVILIEDATKHKEVLAQEVTLDEVKEKFPMWLDRSEREQKSLVVDVKPDGRHIIQVDEASAEVMQMLAPVSFMTVETSTNNGQVWLALPQGLDAPEIKVVKDRLFAVLKAKGANKGASGGLRWIGTRNFKPERKAVDGSFPHVRLLAYNMGRFTTAKELDELGLLTAQQKSPQFRLKGNATRQSHRARREPSYEIAVESVKRKPDGGVDRSGVDLHYAVTCLNWGFTEGETVDLLNTHSPKAQERRDRYAESVVEAASRRANPPR